MLYMYQVTSPSVVSWLPTLKDQLHSQPYCLCSLRTPMRVSCKMSHGTRQFKAQPQHTSPCRRDQHLAKLQRFLPLLRQTVPVWTTCGWRDHLLGITATSPWATWNTGIFSTSVVGTSLVRTAPHVHVGSCSIGGLFDAQIVSSQQMKQLPMDIPFQYPRCVYWSLLPVSPWH